MRSIPIRKILCIGIFTVVAFVCLNRFKPDEPNAKGSSKPDTAMQQAVSVSSDRGLDNGATIAAGFSNSITYYNQGDPAWGSYLYGGSDPMVTHGCGPTALAMAVTSLTGTPVTPIDTAEWAAQNGCFSQGNGSAHDIIPDGAKSYGLTVEKLAVMTPEGIRTALSYHKLLIFLMGPGEFADSGHFIVVYGYLADGTLQIADPASTQRSSRTWTADELISQLMTGAKAGGPGWVLSK